MVEPVEVIQADRELREAVVGLEWPGNHAAYEAELDQLIARHRLSSAPASVEGLREALTPSADTKAAYHGEFQFNVEYADEDGNSYWQPHLVPWDTVKEIMAAIRNRAAITSAVQGEG